jgi:L-2-hydroxycarboxylate dehydrogenase (NAD+)
MKISYKQEQLLCHKLLTASGMNDKDAEILADSIAHSDFTGIYSHGLSRFSNYLKRFANGAMKANANLTVTNDTGSTVSFDCDNGSGVVQMAKVYKQMAVRAKQYGIVIATGRKASNIGCGSFFANMAVNDDLIGMFCCNTVRCVAPFGGADRVLGTNPIVVGAPAKEELPLILDISTTITAMGKIQAAAREGKPIPEGWALDEEGNPTTDAKKAKTVVPIAGPKGYGLAVMVEMFSALLAQAAYGEGIGFPNKGEAENTGFAMILIDVAKFMPADQFKSSVDAYIRNIKASRKAKGVNEILMPGELEFKRYEQYLKTGYEVSEALGAELAGYGEKFGLIPEGAGFDALVASL